MKRARHWLLLLLTLTLGSVGNGMAEPVAESEEIELLFVMSAVSGEAESDIVLLHDVPAVIYFADRPERKTGHVLPSKFVELWEKTEGFGEDHPNAVLSVFGIDDTHDTVVEVLFIDAAGDAVRLTARVLEGELPTGDFGAASVSFDPIRGNSDNGLGI